MSATASVASAIAEPRARGARRWLAAKTANPEAFGMHGGAARSRMASVYWHNAICPNPSLARRAPVGQARPEASTGRHGRGAVDDVLCPKTSNLRRLICEGGCVARLCAKSVGRISASVSQCQTRHRKPGRIITDARQELPAARRRHPSLPQALECSPGSRKDASGGGWVDRDPQQESQRWPA